MTDIVERLRSGEDGLEYAAADEIERLREEKDEWIGRYQAELDDNHRMSAWYQEACGERDGALGLAKRHMDEKHRMQRQAAEDWDVLQQRIKTAEAERDALRVALMPFALAAPLDLAPEMDEQYVDTSSDMFYDLTYGYFRNARAALRNDRT